MGKAVRVGYKILLKSEKDDGSDLTVAMRAAVAAVSAMEDHPAFNAGYGSMLCEDGEVEMDAGVVEGNTLKYGAVGAISKFAKVIVTFDVLHCMVLRIYQVMCSMPSKLRPKS